MDLVATINRKVDTFRRDPIRAVKAKILSGWYVLRYVIRLIPQQYYETRLKRSNVWGTIEKFLSKRPADAFPPVLDDLWFLYSMARQTKPKVILEFGSGISTAVLTQAIVDNGIGHLYSVDANRLWADSTRDCMPAHFSGYYDIVHCPLEEIVYKDVPTFRHLGIPEVIPDLVYLDGPLLTDRVEIASDILFMEDKLPQGGFIVIDGRIKNMKFLNKYLQRPHRLIFRRCHFNSVIELTEFGANNGNEL
jgi:hypothetical protein